MTEIELSMNVKAKYVFQHNNYVSFLISQKY